MAVRSEVDGFGHTSQGVWAQTTNQQPSGNPQFLGSLLGFEYDLLGGGSLNRWTSLLTNIGMVEFLLIAALATLQWFLHRVRGAGWAALAFGVLGFASLAGKIISEVQPSAASLPWLYKSLLAIIFLMPYFLFRFAASFHPPRRIAHFLAAGLTIVVLGFTALLKYLPVSGMAPPPDYGAYRLAVVAQWTFLFLFVVIRLWRAGSGPSTTPSYRMRLLALATAGLNLQVIVSALGVTNTPSESLLVHAISVVMGFLFLGALVLPSFVQTLWNRGNAKDFMNAISELVSLRTKEAVASALLPHVRTLVGATSVAFVDDMGNLVAHCPADAPPPVAPVDDTKGSSDTIVVETLFGSGSRLIVRLSPYMPYFGRGELRKLDQLADLVGLAVDRCAWIEQERQIKAEMIHQALHDYLTGLPNRDLLMDRLAQALTGIERRSHALAVMFIDLDRFKLVNDRINHAAGDGVLTEVAARLTATLRTGDTVARVGGDEFIVVAEVEDETNAVLLAGRLRDAITEPIEVGARTLTTTASIGIAMAISSDQDPSQLLQNADKAMYVAKEAGRDRIQLFNERLRAQALEQSDFERDLRRAIDGNELRLEYQPIFRFSDGLAVGVEALVRWDHPERGVLQPESFIPWAEECGLIVPIDAWVLKEACAQAATWASVIPELLPFKLWVNKSPGTFLHGDVVGTIMSTLAATGLHPSLLGLEITESSFMADTERLRTMIAELRHEGISIAIDDFGTGYSSLGYLKRFPVDVVKIDRTFVAGIGAEPETSLVTAFLGMVRSLGVKAVAEGVESEEQGTWLTNAGCDYAQGYIYSLPLGADEATRVLVDSRAGIRVLSAMLGHDPLGLPRSPELETIEL
jgi:diguanylate cyclase (GGDEF)-like protein